MTFSDQHPWIFICSIIYYGAFSHTFFSSDALLLKSGTQAQRKGSSFCPHKKYCEIMMIIDTDFNLNVLLQLFFSFSKKNIFFSPILANTNLLLKIYCESIVKIL